MPGVPDGTPFTAGNFLATGGTLRQKPDITAADGTAVTGNGGFGTPFFCTLAAAPHAAASAGLLKSANPALTPAQIRPAFVSSAIDIETAGTDRDAGAGIVMAFQALQLLGLTGGASPTLGTFTIAESPNVNRIISPGEAGAVTVPINNPGTMTATNVTVWRAISSGYMFQCGGRSGAQQRADRQCLRQHDTVRRYIWSRGLRRQLGCGGAGRQWSSATVL